MVLYYVEEYIIKIRNCFGTDVVFNAGWFGTGVNLNAVRKISNLILKIGWMTPQFLRRK